MAICHRRRICILLLPIVLVGVACATQRATSSPVPPNRSGPAARETATTPPAIASPAGTPPAPEGTISPDEAAAVALARRDLAHRLGLAENEIRIVRVRAVSWPSSALGCPQPGFLYAQVVTPGYQITLAANGQTYEYHTDQGRRAVLCTSS